MVVHELFSRLGLDVDSAAFEVGEKAIAALRGGMAATAAALGAVAVGLVGAAVATAHSADRFADSAEAAGVTAEELQELNYAAGFAGVGLEGLTGALSVLTRNMNAAQGGNKEMAKGFAAAGVSVTDSTGKLRPVQEVLGEIADHLNTLPQGTERSARAMELLGRSGDDLVPMLSKGSAGLRAMAQEARELGVIFSNEEVQSGEEFMDTISQVQSVLKMLVFTIGRPLIEPLKEVMRGFVAWARANKALIQTRITNVVNLLAAGFKVLAFVTKPLIWILGLIADNLMLFAAIAGGVAVAALVANSAAIATTASWYAALGIAAVAAGAEAALAWAVALWPVALIAVAVAALILIVEDLWAAFHGGNSLILNMLRMWQGLADSLMKTDPSSGPLWNFLRGVLGFLIQIGLEGPKLALNMIANFGTFFDWLIATAKSIGPSLVGSIFGPAGGLAANLIWGGGAASPEAAGAVAPAAPATTVVAPTFKGMTFNINAPNAGSPQEVANETHRTFVDFLDEQLRKAQSDAEGG